MPQCLLVCDLAQLLATRFLHPCSLIFHGDADKKKVPGHQAKCTVVVELVLKRDRHNETKC